MRTSGMMGMVTGPAGEFAVTGWKHDAGKTGVFTKGP
jgi:hypothetical protein